MATSGARGSHESHVLAEASQPGGTTWTALRNQGNARRWPARAAAIDRLVERGLLREEGEQLTLP